MIGLPENEPATSLSRPDAVSGPKNQTLATPKVEDSVVEVGGRTHLHFDGMAWPNPTDPTEVQWRLRYGKPTRSDLLLAASHMSAYTQLVYDPQRIRNEKIASLRKLAANTNTSEKS